MKSKAARCLFVVLFPALMPVFGATMAHGTETGEKPATYFLVAQPDLPDPMFQQSVILMLPPTGTPLVIGLIVNKPTKMKLGDLFPDISALKKRTDTAYFGGPVDITTPLVAFQSSQASSKSTTLFKNVYLTVESSVIMGLLKGPHSGQDMRVYLGRAQWTKDQLHDEMMENSWYTVPSDPSLVFSADPAKVWHTLVQQAQMIKTSARGWQTPPVLPRLFPIAWPPRSAPANSTGGAMPAAPALDFR
jgi:putative transcriptional regulator